jgi:chromosomal replication initiator protein
MTDILSEVKSKIAAVISPDSFKTWIEPMELSGYRAGTCVIRVPNVFFRDWVRENYEPLLLTLLRQAAKEDVRIEYLLKKEEGSADRKAVVVKRQMGYNVFNPLYTFENFVVGSSNQFANAGALAVANNPGKTYNPLFIYGGVGLGKTHLLHAIGSFVTGYGKVSPEKVCYIFAEVFTNEMINSIRYDRMEDFRNRFRKMDVLLIDDIQFIAGKERTQEEFFHTFNALYDNRKQIVVTSDKLPREIENFEERLKSRFEWGLIADIQSLDLETKVAILNKKAEINNIALPLDVAFFIASHMADNVRNLEGSLIRIGAYASIHNLPMTIDLAKQIMGNIISEKKREITIDDIIKEVAEYFAVKTLDLKSQKRVRSIIVPRQIAIYLSRKLTDASLAAIGERFSGKDHSTIIHSVRKIEEEIKIKKEFKDTVARIEEKIKST